MKTRKKRTRKKTVVECPLGSSQNPIAVTGLVSKGNRVHLNRIKAVHYERDKHAELEIYFVDAHPSAIGEPYYHPSTIQEGPDIVTDTIGKHLSRLGLDSCGKNGILCYRFKLNRRGFCKQSLELFRAISDIVGIEDPFWIYGTEIYTQTEEWRGKAWREFASTLILEMGIGRR